MKTALFISKNVNKLTKAILIANIAALAILGTALAITSFMPGTIISGFILPWAALYTPQVITNTFYALITSFVVNFATTIVNNRILNANAAHLNKKKNLNRNLHQNAKPIHEFNQQHQMELGKGKKQIAKKPAALSDEELARQLQDEFENECTNTPQAIKDAEFAKKLSDELNLPPKEVEITDELAQSLGFRSVNDLKNNQADIAKRDERIKKRLQEDEALARKIAREWAEELAAPIYAQHILPAAAPEPVAPQVVKPPVAQAPVNKPQIIQKEKPAQINENLTQDKDDDYNYSNNQLKQEIDEFWKMFIPEYIKLRPQLAKDTPWGVNTDQQKNADWLIFMLRDMHYNRLKQLKSFYKASRSSYINRVAPIDPLREFPFIINKNNLHFSFHVENYKHSLDESDCCGVRQNCRIKDAVTSMQTLFIAMMKWGIANNKLKDVLDKIQSGYCIEGVIRNTSDAVKRLDSGEYRMHELITFGLNEYADLVQNTLNKSRNGAPAYKFNDFTDMCAQLKIEEIFNPALIDFLFEVVEPEKRKKLAKTGQPMEDSFTKENIRQNLELTFMLEFSEKENSLPIEDKLLIEKTKALADKNNKVQAPVNKFR